MAPQWDLLAINHQLNVCSHCTIIPPSLEPCNLAANLHPPVLLRACMYASPSEFLGKVHARSSNLYPPIGRETLRTSLENSFEAEFLTFNQLPLVYRQQV